MCLTACFVTLRLLQSTRARPAATALLTSGKQTCRPACAYLITSLGDQAINGWLQPSWAHSHPLSVSGGYNGPVLYGMCGCTLMYIYIHCKAKCKLHEPLGLRLRTHIFTDPLACLKRVPSNCQPGLPRLFLVSMAFASKLQ